MKEAGGRRKEAAPLLDRSLGWGDRSHDTPPPGSGAMIMIIITKGPGGQDEQGAGEQGGQE